MSLRRSARQSTTLVAKTNGISPSTSSGTRQRTNGEDGPPQTQKKRVQNDSLRDASDTESATFKVPPVPVTLLRKRSGKATKPPHLTPTPSLIGLIRTPYSSGNIDDVTPPPSGSNFESSSRVNSIAVLVPTFFTRSTLKIHTFFMSSTTTHSSTPTSNSVAQPASHL
jgi:hypothetical protein